MFDACECNQNASFRTVTFIDSTATLKLCYVHIRYSPVLCSWSTNNPPLIFDFCLFFMLILG